jgi:16S rRNA G966 N2-methylase RsmD
MAAKMNIRSQTVTQFLHRPDQWQGPYDIVFADPPYAAWREAAELLGASPHDKLFAPGARLIIEHGRKAVLPDHVGSCAFQRAYRYGDTTLSLYAAAGAPPS